MSSWFVIDSQGRRTPAPYQPQSEVTWPSFTYLALRHGHEEAWGKFCDLAARWRLVSEREDVGHLARMREQGEWTILSEPGVEMEARFIQMSCAEYLVGALQCDGMFVSHDEDQELLSFARFEQGHLALVWEDSMLPGGPSDVVTFDWVREQFTQQDARGWAIDKLGREEGMLDRQAFVEGLILEQGHEPFEPERECGQRKLVLLDLNDDETSFE